MIELTVAEWPSTILVKVHNEISDTEAESQQRSEVWEGTVTVTDSEGDEIVGHYQKRHSENEMHTQEFRIEETEIEDAVNDRDDIEVAD